MTDEQMKYPTGKFTPPASYTNEDMQRWINDIKTLPGKLRNAVIGLTEQQLDTPYRQGGWTLRQVIHHVADSHMNCLLRFKWALTEENTIVKPYGQSDWALLPDYRLPVEPSLRLIEGVHQHMTALFESFTEDQWNRTYSNPESGPTQIKKALALYAWHSKPESGPTQLKKALALYAWHSKHHLAHITETIKKF